MWESMGHTRRLFDGARDKRVCVNDVQVDADADADAGMNTDMDTDMASSLAAWMLNATLEELQAFCVFAHSECLRPGNDLPWREFNLTSADVADGQSMAAFKARISLDGHSSHEVVVQQCLHALAQKCMKQCGVARMGVLYEQMEEGTILCVHHTGHGRFRCRAAPGSDEQLKLDTLLAHMDDVYASTPFKTPLAPPYSRAEVEEFESDNHTTLPPLLRHYLLHISRQTACNDFRVTIDLSQRNLEANRVVTPDIVKQGLVYDDDAFAGSLVLSDGGRALYDRGFNVIVKGEGSGHVISHAGCDARGGMRVDPLWEHLLTPNMMCEAARAPGMD